MGKNKEQNKKVIIAVPCADASTMKARTAHSIGCTIISAPNLVTDFLLRISCDVVSSRTWLVNEAIKRGGTHILFVDSDMVFPDEALTQLLAREKEIVGVEYNKREFPIKGVFEPMTERSETELYEAKHLGTGLLLIDLSIFEKLQGPWFNFGRDSQGSLALGEDVWFCNTARDAGYKVWIDPTIKVGHCGEYIY
jgi:hypothetical protein